MKEYRWYGHFNGDDSFTVTEAETPRHFYNYFFNDEYVSFASQVGFGEGLAQDDMGRRILLLSNRNAFLTEDGRYWSLFGLPIGYGYTDYSCRHGQGFSEISLSFGGIVSHVRIFVPNEGRREIWSVTMENRSDRVRSLRLVAYAKTEIDGVYRPQAYNIGVGGFMNDRQAVYARDHKPLWSKGNRPVYAVMTSSAPISGYDSRHNAFIGPYGDHQHPVALQKTGRLSNSDCNSEKLCLALENEIRLEPGACETVHFQVSVALSPDEITSPTDESVETEFVAMRKRFSSELGGVRIRTPWEPFDHLINGWMTYASDMGSRWARVRHNGYRDMTSDTDCLAVVNPTLAWERFKRVLSYQYQSGYAPRTFIDGEIRDNHFSDNAVWMTFTATTLVNELGNPNLLLTDRVRFNDTEEAYPVYEHLKRAIKFLYEFQGLYGLIRIWGGDWNDCVNLAGMKGKGVSVWLSIAWRRASRQFARLARLLGFEDDALWADECGRIMEERIEKYGWDEKGGYYIYARTDDDIVLGGADSEEGKIFLIPQLWAVLAELPRAKQAMERAEEELEIPLGIRLAYPAYSHQYDYLGSIGEKAPGVQDNGGIYLHTSAWKLAVDSLLRRPDRVEEGLRKMLPFDTTYFVKCGEPYAMFNSYFAPETGYREGTPGQSWRTASSSWLLKSTVEFVFGLHAEQEGLRIEPCLPLSWTECGIQKRFRGCVYDISFHGDGEGADVLRVLVNGAEVSGNVIPPVPGETLRVEVIIGKKR